MLCLDRKRVIAANLRHQISQRALLDSVHEVLHCALSRLYKRELCLDVVRRSNMIIPAISTLEAYIVQTCQLSERAAISVLDQFLAVDFCDA